MQNRRTLIATIGYIMGIIIGLYCKISIVLFYLLSFCIYLIFKKENKRKIKFKLFSFKRYSRYLKIIFTKSIINIIIVFSIISNTIVILDNNKYQNLYKNLDGKEISIQATVVDVLKNKYKIKVLKKGYRNTYLYLTNIKKTKLEYGDKINITGIYCEPRGRTNFKGFDYKKYLKTVKVYGTIKDEKIKIISKNNSFILFKQIHKISKSLNNKIENLELTSDEKALLKCMLIGNKEDLTEDIINNFEESNMSHILAISGMHIGYIILVSSFIFNKIFGKHFGKIITSIFIVFFMLLTNFTPSVLRAGITGIILILSNFFYRRYDNIEAVFLALLIILVYNPFLIQDIGLQLSFAGVLGIILFSSNIKKWLKDYFEKANTRAIRKNRKIKKYILQILNKKIFINIGEAVIISISCSITIFPIILISFNKINITNIILSTLSVYLVGPIIIVGFIALLSNIKQIEIIASFLLKTIINISKMGGKMPLSQIYFITPSIITIFIYYVCIFLIFNILKIKIEKNKNSFQKRVLNLFYLVIFKIKKYLKKIISIICVILLIFNLYIFIPKDLKLHFIDVGQGDSCLIITPKNKSILIDGGGSETFNVGSKTLMPYLLDRKIMSIDYILISHFDTDHVKGLLYIIQKMRIKNIIISKQPEKSQNFEELMQIIKNKNVNLITVNAGDKIKIEKDVYLDILWPDSKTFISENMLNNNSIVCKLVYKNFTCLFTGDIEEIAEKQILQKYKNNLKVLNSTILKVAHHGSKTSTTQEFLEKVHPKIALIGVGKDNKFGHPNDEVLKRLQNLRY